MEKSGPCHDQEVNQLIMAVNRVVPVVPVVQAVQVVLVALVVQDVRVVLVVLGTVTILHDRADQLV